jgi:N-acetylmuramoyl-L-alanine amidase
MKKLSVISLSLFWIFFLSLALAKQAQSQIVVIDAGHGYNANGSNGDERTATEINTNWSVSIKLRDQIQNNNIPWTVHLTRPNNGAGSQVDLNSRSAMSNNWNADRLLSIHCNATNPPGLGNGTETFWCDQYNDQPSVSNVDEAMAREVQARMVQYGVWFNRNISEDNPYLPFHLGILNHTIAPACLNEIGFVDNASNAAKLLDNAWRDNFANAYYVALQNSLGAVNPPPGNDNCSSAILLTSNTACSFTSGTVLNATASGLSKPSCDGFPGTPQMYDVWYKFTATGSSQIVTVDPSTSIGDPVVAVYSSCGGSPIGCSDLGGGVTENLSLSGLTVGNTYYVRIYDYGSSPPPGADANFQVCVTGTTVGLPDLTVTAGTQSVSPTSVAAGSSVTASCSEDNSGSSAAGANVVSLYLSTDSFLTPGSNGDTYLDFIQFPSVAANSNSPVSSKNIQIPSGTAPGTYYFFFWADGEQDVSESTEGNNFATRQLTVTGVPIPTITTSVASLPSFGSVAVGQNSAPQSYTVSGSNLSANISIQAPAGFQISLSSTSGFTSALTLTRSGSSVPTTTVYARFSPQASGAQTGNISHTSSGATAKNVSVSGTGTGGGAGTVQFSSATYSVNENGGSRTITVTRTGGTSAVGVSYATSNGTATAGADYTGSSGTLSFATNETSKTFTVPIIDDASVEGNETVNLTLSNPTGGATLGSPSSAVLTIVDNDTGCTYSISSSENEVGPGNGGGTFLMDAPSGCSWSAVSDSTSWLTTSSSGSGDGSVSYNFMANPSTSPRTGHITVGGRIHTVTQIGLGGAGSVQFSSTTYSANEGGGIATITVTRTGGTGTGTVNYSTSNGTATAGIDYTPASGLLLFTGSVTSLTFNVTILDDAAFEGNETINLLLSSPSNSFTPGNPSTATLTIIDNDISPLITVTAQTNPVGRSFTVDGTTYTTTQTLSWTAGSSHTISTASPQSGGTGTQYLWSNWSDSGAISHTVSPTNNTTYTANFTTQYFLTMNAGTGGTVSPPSGYFNSGQSLSISASPISGFNFSGWTGSGSGSFTGSSNPASVTMSGPINETASFTNLQGGNAVYDSLLKAPKCGPGSFCDSGTLLDGRDSMSGGPESNQPNTINTSCADGTGGTYHSDESVDRIKVSTLDGNSFAAGKTVKIEVTVWAWDDPTQDHLDLYYAADASNPNWLYLITLEPSSAGAQVLSATYTLPSGGNLQAVRAVFRFGGSPSPCGSNSGFDDHDDLIFATGGAPQPLQLVLEEFGPSSSQAAALDAMSFLRDPFPVVNGADLLNLGSDRNTRVTIYAMNLQLAQGEPFSSVVVNLIDSNGLSYDIAAEDVRLLANVNFTQVIFRLPNNLPVGTCTIKLKAHGQVSNSGTVRIRL